MTLQALAAPARTRGTESRRSSAAPARSFAQPESTVTLRRCACGGSCPRCQAAGRLAINTPGDAFEREAERAADAVMSGAPAAMTTAPPALRRCACGGSCPSCQQEKEEELHRADTGAGGTPGVAPPKVHDVLASPGRPLAAPTRGFMEQRFGADFSGVRVHDDASAAESARAVDAHAYAVGGDLVFAAGRYAPGSPSGDRLLAHELAHTLQQGEPTLRRKWDAATTECAGQPTDKWVETVEVDQSTPQSVTLNWSDGSTDTDQVSTGKGQCCVEPGSGAGGTCDEKRSRVFGTNCTPVTKSAGTPIINRDLDHNGVLWWSEIDSRRAIALHEYSPVDGTPLSHGCLRLNAAMAKKLFCGAKRNRTIVHIRNLARPMCDHPALRDEWVSDFALAGTDPLPEDGELRGQIREERRALEKAFGRKLTPTELQGFTADDIPRCRIATVEEERSGKKGDGSEPEQILKSSGFDKRVKAFEKALTKVNGPKTAEAAVRKHAGELWEAAVGRAQGSAANSDDRPVYWARLRMLRALRLWVPPGNVGADGQRRLLQLFERISRGMESAAFTPGEGEKQILLAGFDPFSLSGIGIRRGNPSGAAVLSLDGRRLTGGGVTAEVQGVVFPVRFADFDAGLVEQVVRPHLTAANPVEMVMTISQGGGVGFEAEQFAARARTTSAEDNQDLFGGDTSQPTVPTPGTSGGAEFIETTLPVKEIRGELARTRPLEAETELTEIPAGKTKPVRRPRGGPTKGSTAVSGSGGNYLSNEIFYRTSLLRVQEGVDIPVGHLHTPLMEPSEVGLVDPAYDAERDRIVKMVEKILVATLPAL